MNDMGVYLAFDVDHISMIPTGGEIVACRHSIKVDDEDLAGAYELIRKLYQEVRIERYNLKRENAKLRKLAGGMYGILAAFDAILGNHDACETPRPLIFGENKSFKDVMRELGIEVD